MFKQSTEKEIIDKILNYQQFLKKWDDPSITRFQHVEKIESIPYMKLEEAEEKKEDVKDIK
tara:strand:+ start:25 stop:207 length:183 start_codon:yes stop_codon:yes gene_type:complete